MFATAPEAEALLGGGPLEGLLEFASIAVVKRGAKGATVLARDGAATLRFEAATEALTATDTTGAGDAFDAGFLVGWFTARALGRSFATPPTARRRPAIGLRPASSTPRAEQIG